MQAKTALRRKMKQVLKDLSENERHIQESEVLEMVAAGTEWAFSEWIFGYLSMNGEFNLDALLDRAVNEGKKIALPRVDGSELRFIQVQDMHTAWEIHPYGMREPRDEGLYVDPALCAEDGLLMLVPGLCFDLEGYRLGYGGGFYDRLLSGLRPYSRVKSAACFFRQQLVDAVPREAHDRRLDRLFFTAK